MLDVFLEWMCKDESVLDTDRLYSWKVMLIFWYWVQCYCIFYWRNHTLTILGCKQGRLCYIFFFLFHNFPSTRTVTVHRPFFNWTTSRQPSSFTRRVETRKRTPNQNSQPVHCFTVIPSSSIEQQAFLHPFFASLFFPKGWTATTHCFGNCD